MNRINMTGDMNPGIMEASESTMATAFDVLESEGQVGERYLAFLESMLNALNRMTIRTDTDVGRTELSTAVGKFIAAVKSSLFDISKTNQELTHEEKLSVYEGVDPFLHEYAIAHAESQARIHALMELIQVRFTASFGQPVGLDKEEIELLLVNPQMLVNLIQNYTNLINSISLFKNNCAREAMVHNDTDVVITEVAERIQGKLSPRES